MKTKEIRKSKVCAMWNCDKKTTNRHYRAEYDFSVCNECYEEIKIEEKLTNSK